MKRAAGLVVIVEVLFLGPSLGFSIFDRRCEVKKEPSQWYPRPVAIHVGHQCYPYRQDDDSSDEPIMPPMENRCCVCVSPGPKTTLKSNRGSTKYPFTGDATPEYGESTAETTGESGSSGEENAGGTGEVGGSESFTENPTEGESGGPEGTGGGPGTSESETGTLEGGSTAESTKVTVPGSTGEYPGEGTETPGGPGGEGTGEGGDGTSGDTEESKSGTEVTGTPEEGSSVPEGTGPGGTGEGGSSSEVTGTPEEGSSVPEGTGPGGTGEGGSSSEVTGSTETLNPAEIALHLENKIEELIQDIAHLHCDNDTNLEKLIEPKGEETIISDDESGDEEDEYEVNQ